MVLPAVAAVEVMKVGRFLIHLKVQPKKVC